MLLLIRKSTVLKLSGIMAMMCLTVLGSIHFARTVGNGAVAVSAEGNWGLSFQTEGEAPVANVTEKYLNRYNGCYIGDTSRKVIYLTFDCGYEKGYTEGMLDVLKRHHATAAFFVVGNYVEDNPELIHRMVREGHIIGNHTYSHPDMSAISNEDSFRKELEALETVYKGVTGKSMKKYYRPPQGKYSERNLELAEKLGYKTIFWSLAYVDWYENDQPTADEAFSKLIPRIHNGAIVLLHNTSETNSKVLDELLTTWEKMGYHFKSLDTLP